MRTFILLIVCVLAARHAPLRAAPTVSFPDSLSRATGLSINPSDLSARDLEKMTGIKLSLKEKVLWGIYKKKLSVKNKSGITNMPELQGDPGAAAKTFGILSLICLFIPYLSLLAIPFAIIAIVKGSRAKRKDPLNRKARTGITLGIVTLSLLVAALVVAIIILSGLTF